MENDNKEEDKKPLPSEGENQGETESTESTEQDPLKTELDKVQKNQGRSKKEKLLFTKKRVEEQLKELGDEDDEELDEDDKPVTVGMLKKLQSAATTKTALQLADDITDETERELTKYHIENTIRPSGDPKKDLENAQVHVNAVKNKRIIEEVMRKPEAKQHSSGGGNPAKNKQEEEFSAEELSFMRAPFNLTKAQVLAARKGE